MTIPTVIAAAPVTAPDPQRRIWLAQYLALLLQRADEVCEDLNRIDLKLALQKGSPV